MNTFYKLKFSVYRSNLAVPLPCCLLQIKWKCIKLKRVEFCHVEKSDKELVSLLQRCINESHNIYLLVS